jgi:peptidyl-dipeptidase Dcp
MSKATDITDNPLMSVWPTPFEAPPFAAIKPEHFADAFTAGMAAHLGEIDAISTNPAPATFANTLHALEASGEALSRAASVFWNLSGSHTNDALQALERDWSPKFANHGTAISTNAALFHRIDAVFQKRASAGLTAEQLRVLEKTHLRFVRAGAKLEGADRERYKLLMQHSAQLATKFAQNVLADEKSYALPLSDAADLAGLPDFLIAAAASAAKERGSSDSHVITLSRSLIEPFLTFSSRRDLREQAWRAFVERGEHAGDHDNRAVIADMVRLRVELAGLMGHKSYADYSLVQSMAKTPARVRELLDRVWPPAVRRAHAERAKLQDMATQERANITIEPWDWRYYAEKVRQAEFNLDEAALKPYLPLDNMIEAAFYTATQLFGVTFKARPDVPVYHPDVRAFEVTDSQGRPVGLFLADYFARSSKRSGAWMSAFRSQDRLNGERDEFRAGR